MKKLIIPILAPLIILLSSYSYSQEIDPSLLKNLSPAQIEMAKNQLAKSEYLEQPKPVAKESTTKATFNGDLNDSLNKKYGYNYFSSAPTSISAVGDLPLPNDYKISLNDQFTVILSGSKEGIFDLNVNLDGSILFPELGSIYVVGETFQEVKTKLKNLVNQSYIGAQIDLSLKNLSAKKITIVGAVKTPGTYLVNPFSTISSALGYSGGISEIGTLRDIKLIRTNGETYIFDLYKLLINGDRSGDITIESGDVIIIDPAEQFININGQVKRPAIYEIKQDETLGDLIKFALGFSQIANKSNINLNLLDIKSSSIKSKNVSNLDIILADVLSVNVNMYVNKNIASIKVGGAVKEPGFYSVEDNETLEDIINKLEFINVYPWLAVLEQFDDDNLIKHTALISLKDPSTYRSIKVLPNSKLFFADINSRAFPVSVASQKLIADYDLELKHGDNTYILPVFGKFEVRSFTDYLGLDMSDVDDEATYISPLDDFIAISDYRDMRFLAKKYHTVSFRSPVNNLITVNISGAVDYPGTYIMSSNSVIEDLYQQVGNFKPEAFLKGIILSRESIKNRQLESIQRSKEALNKAILASTQKGEDVGDISIIKALTETAEPSTLGRMAGNFSPGAYSTKNTLLLDGDTLFVPKNPNAINVLGEVLNPIAFEYSKGISVRSAIESAGGYQDAANKRKVYIIKANGIIERPNRNIFTKNIRLEPGDTIVVPRKIITSNPGLEALLPITNILSDLAFSAAAIESLTNTN
jgi:polysaccharide biosynthesis/export protein